MKSPPDDDPTAEEEALEFDGTATDQLDDRYRVVVAETSEASPRGIDRVAGVLAPKPGGVHDPDDAIPAKEIEPVPR